MSTPVPRPGLEGQMDPNRRQSEGDPNRTEAGLTVSGVPELGNHSRGARITTTNHGQLDIDVSQFNRLHLSTEPEAFHEEPSYILPSNPYASSHYAQQGNWAQGGYQGFPPMYSPVTPHSAGYSGSPSVFYPPSAYGRPPPGNPYYHVPTSPRQSNPSPPHLSRPGTAQTQASYHTGEYSSPPMSPNLASSSRPRKSQSRQGDSRQGSWSFDDGLSGRGGHRSSAWSQQPHFVYVPYHRGYPDGNSASSEGWASVAVSPVTGQTPLMGNPWQMSNQGWNQNQPPQQRYIPRPPPQARPYGSFQFGMNQDHISTPTADVPVPRAASVAGHGNGEVEEKERERKAYHPQPPAKRSEWVMWVGNVPNNVSHEELWRFFNSVVPPPVPSSDAECHWQGPSSIFLISRSSCAFVNLSSVDDLDRAVTFFNGRSLRPWDPRCPRLVCRIRKKDDDLKAGVGGQRGMGMHRAWVRGQAAQENHRPADLIITGSSEDRSRELSQELTPQGEMPGTPLSRGERSASGSVPPSPAVGDCPPDGEGRRRESLLMYENERKEREKLAGNGKHHSTGSNASTNSSFLVRNFPKRLFILKSMTIADLQTSVQTGTWSTQKHNEPILDQAFRTSPEVYLIFSANRSGEFFGYARMTEASNKQDRRNVAWQAKQSLEEKRSLPSMIDEEVNEATNGQDSNYLFSPSMVHVASSSPSELTPAEPPSSALLHAPGERKTDPHQWGASPILIDDVGSRSATLDPQLLRPKPSYFPSMSKIDFEADHADPHLDSHPRGDDATPIKAVAEQQAQGPSSRPQMKDKSGVLRKDTILSPREAGGELCADGDQAPSIDSQAESWGAAFKIEWIRVGPLPFTRLRHLRNPWNGDKEVKVSRDGTEVEPNVGALLIAEWDHPKQSHNPHSMSTLAEQSQRAIRA